MVRLFPDTKVPIQVYQSCFCSISKSDEELSIVCETGLAPKSHKIEKNWRLIKVVGPLDFSLTGILASLAHPLAEHKISIFAISTFDTDYLLVKDDKLEQAKNILKDKGFNFQ